MRISHSPIATDFIAVLFATSCVFFPLFSMHNTRRAKKWIIFCFAFQRLPLFCLQFCLLFLSRNIFMLEFIITISQWRLVTDPWVQLFIEIHFDCVYAKCINRTKSFIIDKWAKRNRSQNKCYSQRNESIIYLKQKEKNHFSFDILTGSECDFKWMERMEGLQMTIDCLFVKI